MDHFVCLVISLVSRTIEISVMSIVMSIGLHVTYQGDWEGKCGEINKAGW